MPLLRGRGKAEGHPHEDPAGLGGLPGLRAVHPVEDKPRRGREEVEQEDGNMSFVYRYVDDSGAVRYIGRVFGSPLSRLGTRIDQHKHDEGFDPSWRVEYIDNLSNADADILETWLIAKLHQAPLLNSAKRWGPTAITITGLPAFKPWDPSSAGKITGVISGKVPLYPVNLYPPKWLAARLASSLTSPTMALPAFITVREASQITGIPEEALKFGIKEGVIPHRKDKRKTATKDTLILSSCLPSLAIVLLPDEEVSP